MTMAWSFRIEDEFRLLLRTRDLSPPVIEVISLAFGAAPLAQQIYGSIRGKREAWRRKVDLYYNLFGLCANADFITNQLDPDLREKLRTGKEEPWLTSDLIAGEEAIGYFIKIFEQKPEVKLIQEKELKRKPEVALPQFEERNVVSLGGPCRNRFSRWMMKLEDPPPELEMDIRRGSGLHFVFNYDLPESKDKSWEERAKLHPRPNWPIKDVRKGKDIYVPETYYFEDGSYVCKRDYAMIVKMKSIHIRGREQGKWNLVLAGCHGSGTEGAAMALGSEDILQEIWTKVKDRDFQVILAVDVGTAARGRGRKFGKPRKVELLEIVDLTEESEI